MTKKDAWKQVIDLKKQVDHLYDGGKYIEAIDVANQLCDHISQRFGEKVSEFAAGLSDLGLLHQALGKYSEARDYYRRALEIMLNGPGEDDPDYAITLGNVAALDFTMGDYDSAKDSYQKVLEVIGKHLGEKSDNYAITLNNRAYLYLSMGDFSSAQGDFERALDITGSELGETDPAYAIALHNLAGLYDARGDYIKAEPLYIEALEIMLKTKNYPEYAAFLCSLAHLKNEMGEYVTAKDYYLKALEIKRKVFPKNSIKIEPALSSLAMAYYDLGDYSNAKRYLPQAAKIVRWTLGMNHPDYAVILSNLAKVQIAINRVKEGFALAKREQAIRDKMVGQVFSIGSERQRMTYRETLQVSLEVFLSLVLQYFSQSPVAIKAALELVLRRKALGAEALAIERSGVLGGKYSELKPKLGELDELREQIANMSYAGPGPEGLKAHEQYLSKLNATREQLEAELARRIPEMDLQKKFGKVDCHAIAKKLPANSALIEFVRFQEFDFKAAPYRGDLQWKEYRYLVFVIHAGQPDKIRMVDLGEAKTIDDMIASFRASIIGREDDRDIESDAEDQVGEVAKASDGNDLRKALFDKLVHALDGKKRLFICPDGDLARLPFETLPTGKGRRLIDKYQISYLSVARDILRLGRVSADQPLKPLIVADPDYDLTNRKPAEEKTVHMSGRHSRDLNRGSMHFDRLKGTREEGRKIGKLLGVKPFLGKEALEGRLKACKSPHILHIATHGYCLPTQKPNLKDEKLSGPIAKENVGIQGRLSGPGMENPLLRSGLALAGANTWARKGSLPPEAEDALLNGEDVSGMDLLDTELVVLSACGTALGQVHTGEGVFGLGRAFMLAGAKTLIMSLWRVPDTETQKLMVEFYKLILDGEPRADALRKAQRVMKKKKEYADPYYWGAFICQGDPGPLHRFS